MSNIINLTQQLAKLSRELLNAQDSGDEAEVERIEELMMDISDELDDETDFEERHQYN